MTILQKKSRVDYSRALPRAVPTKGSPKKVNRVRKFKSALQKQMTKAVERERSGKENKSIKISGAVEEVIHREVEQLLDGRRANNLPCTLEDVVNTKNLPCTLEDVVNTICEGDGKHTFADESPFGKKKGGILRGIILELKRSFKMMRRFHFVNAFRAFLERDDTNATSIESWEQAKHIFSSKIIFLQNDVAPKRIDTADTNNVATLSEGMKGLSVVPFNHDKDDHEVSKYEAVLREIATASIPKKIRQPAGEVDDPSREETARLQALHLEKKKSKVVEAVQHRMSEKEKEKEAKKLAESLLRELTSEEEAAVNKAMYGGGPDNEVLYSLGPDSVQRASLHRLQLGEWLNDEVISYFYVMLAKRDEELCSQDPSRKRSHFFKSFFMTKLLNEGHTDPAMEGTYDYRQVKRWSKKVPGKDIFNLDKIFFPINQGRMHWICAVAFMQEKRIQFYDSMGSSGKEYLEAIFRYIQDEHQDKKKAPLPDKDQWTLVPCTRDTPRQRNGFDCGVFTCMFADFIAKDCPLMFNQEHITECRKRIALSICQGKAII